MELAVSNFWEFDVGNAVTIVVLAVGWLVQYIRLTSKVDELNKASNERFEINKEANQILQNLFKQLNENGGVATRGRLAVIETALKDHGERIRALEITLPTLDKKIDLIANNIVWIMRKLGIENEPKK